MGKAQPCRYIRRIVAGEPAKTNQLHGDILMYDVNSLVAVGRFLNRLFLDAIFADGPPDQEALMDGMAIAILSDNHWHDELSDEQWQEYVEVMQARTDIDPADGSLDPVTVGSAIFKTNDDMFQLGLAGMALSRQYALPLATWANAKAPGWEAAYAEKVDALRASTRQPGNEQPTGQTLEIGGEEAYTIEDAIIDAANAAKATEPTK